MGFTRGLKNAIDLSTGKYIAIHGSGDFSLSERIEKQVRFMEKNTSISVVGCNVLNIQAETGAESLHKPKKSKIREKGIYKFSYTQGEIMIRRSDYDKIGGYRSEIKYGQLSDLLYRISIIGKMDVIDETLYKRYFYNDGVSQIVYKKLLQKYYQNVSYQCAVQRVKYGEDIIDKYGDNFHIFRNKSTHLSDQYILQLYRLNLCKKDKMIVIKTSMNEKITLFNFLMFLTKGSIAIKGNKLSEFIGNLFKFEAYVRILINRYY